MKLGQKQRLFSRLVAQLILFMYENGYEVSLGDAKATTGHCPGSNHYIQLAIDLNLFRDGVYLTKTDDHLFAGEHWESLHPLCRWGGRFGDGNHYSMEHKGRK